MMTLTVEKTQITHFEIYGFICFKQSCQTIVRRPRSNSTSLKWLTVAIWQSLTIWDFHGLARASMD